MVTTRFYPAVPHGTALQALPQMVRWLVNDHPTYTGPGWTIIEAYDSTTGRREVPSSPSNIDSLIQATGWRDGSVAITDWIILESANANNTNHFQVCFFASALSAFNIMMLPQSGHQTAAGLPVSPPAFPTASFGASSGTVFGVRASPVSATYTVVADEGMAAFMCSRTDGIPLGWTYIGELDGARASGSPPDNRTYVAWTSTSGAFWDDALTTAPRAFHRYSPLQVSGTNTWLTGTTNGGAPCYFTAAGAGTIVHNTTTIDTLLNVNSVLPVGVYFGGGIHRHFAGFLRNVYSMHADITSSAGSTAYNGTTSDRRFRYNNSLSGVDAPVVFAWDGTTAFP